MYFDPTGWPLYHFSVQYTVSLGLHIMVPKLPVAVTDMINRHQLKISQNIYGQLS